MGRQHGNLRPQRLDPRRGLPLVFRVGVGVQEADGDGLHFLGLEEPQHLRQGRQIHRFLHFALVVGALIEFLPQIAFDKGLGLSEIEVEQVRTIASGYFQHVSEPLGGDQGGLDALPFRQGVDDDGGAVGEEGKMVGRKPRLLHGGHDAPLEIRRRGVRFCGFNLAAGARGRVHRIVNEVGKGAADIAGRPELAPSRHGGQPFRSCSGIAHATPLAGRGAGTTASPPRSCIPCPSGC